MEQALGRHILCEAYGCDPEVLNDRKVVEQIMVDAALLTGAEVREVAFHKFSPQGVSGVVVISESHLAIHTWPELGYAAIDVFTCGDTVDPWKACQLHDRVVSGHDGGRPRGRRGGLPPRRVRWRSGWRRPHRKRRVGQRTRYESNPNRKVKTIVLRAPSNAARRGRGLSLISANKGDFVANGESIKSSRTHPRTERGVCMGALPLPATAK